MVKVPMVEKLVDVPADVDVDVAAVGDKFAVSVSGPKGKIERTFVHDRVKIEIANTSAANEAAMRAGNSRNSEGRQKEDVLSPKSVRVFCYMPRRKDKALVGTWAAHINNMVKGVKYGFTYHMRVVYSHFPIKLEVRGNELLIHNFMGEKLPRKARIMEGVKVEVKGKDVYLHGINIEVVGQTAANIEAATKVKDRDPRVFQDGVYIVGRRVGK